MPTVRLPDVVGLVTDHEIHPTREVAHVYEVCRVEALGILRETLWDIYLIIPVPMIVSGNALA